MVSKEDKYECRVCGIELECISGCGCCEADLICCGKPMKKIKKTAAKKKTAKKTAAKKKTAKKTAAKKKTVKRR